MIKPLSYYDKIVISFSGGKDSMAMLLFLLQEGARKDQIEIWHQAIDGLDDTHISFFDWPSTHGYVQNVAYHFNLPLDYQWREYGFFGEMFRVEERTNAVRFQRNGEDKRLPSSKQGKIATRLKWPAKNADLNTRWCSAYLKIDVAARALNNIPDLHGKKILFVTGERREESISRSKYKESELHRTNSRKKLVHHWRPVIDWPEEAIWEIMEKNMILPHPAYFLGFPRLSCRSCIFYNKNHWATLKDVDPNIIKRISKIEEALGFTIDNKLKVDELVRLGESHLKKNNTKYIKKAISYYDGPVVTKNWKLPEGAYGSGGGAI